MRLYRRCDNASGAVNILRGCFRGGEIFEIARRELRVRSISQVRWGVALGTKLVNRAPGKFCVYGGPIIRGLARKIDSPDLKENAEGRGCGLMKTDGKSVLGK